MQEEEPAWRRRKSQHEGLPAEISGTGAFERPAQHQGDGRGKVSLNKNRRSSGCTGDGQRET